MKILVKDVRVILGVITLLLYYGVFELTFDKKAGVPFLREIVILLALLSLIPIYLFKPYIFKLRSSVIVFTYVLSFLTLSSVFSYWWHDQPLFYSILEERRILNWAWFFIAIWMLLKFGPNESEVEVFFYYSGWILVGYSFLYYFSIIPDQQVGSSFIEQYYYADDDPRNATRYVFSSNLLIMVCALSFMKFFKKEGGKQWELLCFMSLLVLFLINQGRLNQISIIVIGVLAFWFRFPKNLKVIYFLVGSILVFAGLLYLSTSENEYVRWLVDSALNEQGVRQNTSKIIISELQDSALWGKGALSIQYNFGFQEIYNPNFWLADVGKLGLVYRFGVFSILFFSFFIWIAYKAWKQQKRKKSDLLTAMFLCYLILLLNPMSGMYSLFSLEFALICAWEVTDESYPCG